MFHHPKRFLLRVGWLTVALLPGLSSPALAGRGEIDKWPSLDEAVRAAAEPIVEFLDQKPGLERRHCAIRLEESTPTDDGAVVRLVLVLAEHGFDAPIVGSSEVGLMPVVDFSHQSLGNKGIVRADMRDERVSGVARYEQADWAVESTNPVSLRGPYTIVVGRSGWCDDVVAAVDEARANAIRLLAKRSASDLPEFSASQRETARLRRLVLRAAQDDFFQQRRADGYVMHRVTSRFVVPTADLQPSVEAPTRAIDWRIPTYLIGFAIIAGGLGVWLLRPRQNTAGANSRD